MAGFDLVKLPITCYLYVLWPWGLWQWFFTFHVNPSMEEDFIWNNVHPCVFVSCRIKPSMGYPSLFFSFLCFSFLFCLPLSNFLLPSLFLQVFPHPWFPHSFIIPFSLICFVKFERCSFSHIPAKAPSFLYHCFFCSNSEMIHRDSLFPMLL